MMTREEAIKIEVGFEWTCPTCGHPQTDTVNPVLGPFVTVICGDCGRVFDQHTLPEAAWNAFDKAVTEAESYYTEP